MHLYIVTKRGTRKAGLSMASASLMSRSVTPPPSCVDSYHLDGLVDVEPLWVVINFLNERSARHEAGR